MTWQEIYKKHKDSELMKEFLAYCKKECVQTYKEDFDLLDWKEYNIKDIWGYLICFAETKGYYFDAETSYSIALVKTYKEANKILCRGTYDDKTVEETMLWCANKFFEVA